MTPKSSKKAGKKAKAGAREYSKFRTRWRHVVVIDREIRSGRAPNCRVLAERLEVCRRTVLRDVDFLRYDLGAPVEYDAARRGYVYTEPNWSMPSIRISEGELFSILVAEKALEAYAGTPWSGTLKKVFGRMVGGLPHRIEVAPQELLHRVSFDPNAAMVVDADVLEAVGDAIKHNRTLRMTYYALWRDEVREYTIDPYVLRHARGAWYLAARDHRTDHVPLFNVSRIRRIEPTPRTFSYEASAFDSEEYFGSTFGTYQTAERIRVIVEFSGPAARLVAERHWHSSQKLTPLRDGRLRLEVTVAHLDDVWPWVLSWGEGARALAPKSLVKLLAEKTAAVAKLYRKNASAKKRKNRDG